jgi:hypothetical protein
MPDLTDLRLRKKGQLADLAVKRRTLAAQADNLLVTVLAKSSDTISDAADLDTEGLMQAATDLHLVCTALRETDKTITRLHNDLYG